MTLDEETALIGYTGFVGSNLRRQRSFDALFNSSNIGEIAGRSFDLAVCAGAPAEKWRANAEPERDLENIQRLARALEHATISKLVLLSTIDVFLDPANVDEDSPVPAAGPQAYGRNRRLLEEIVASRFDTLIIRLPGLYGPGLKKNILYDLLNDNETHKIDSRGVFQFYGVDRLWTDIGIALDAGLTLLHLPTEPVSVAEIAREAFGFEFTNEVIPNPARYDIQTKHAALFGGAGRYVETRAQELAGIREFVRREREARA